MYTFMYIFFILQLKMSREIESTSYLFNLLDFFFFNVLKFKCLCFIVAGRVHALQYIYLGINRSLL